MYKLWKDPITLRIESVIRSEDTACIPFSVGNTDYQTFKAQINAEEAQLEDADGNLMTAEETKAFVNGLA